MVKTQDSVSGNQHSILDPATDSLCDQGQVISSLCKMGIITPTATMCCKDGAINTWEVPRSFGGGGRVCVYVYVLINSMVIGVVQLVAHKPDLSSS